MDNRIERRPVDSSVADSAESSTHQANTKGKGKMNSRHLRSGREAFEEPERAAVAAQFDTG
eukprot:2516257-Karenia_brevis.AAC.1